MWGRLALVVVALNASLACACSHFTMEKSNFVITARTEDLTGTPRMTLFNKPQGSKGLRASKYGYVAFMDSNIRSGMNGAGLMCDKQTLWAATHPNASQTLDNIDAAKICQWALEGYSTVEEMKTGLQSVNFVKSKDPAFAYGHWAFRDANGQGLVIEFTNHTMHLYDDNNDGGQTGYGIMTNDPPFPEHLKTIAEMNCSELNPEVRMPYGSWGSVDRFNRIFLIKSNMRVPDTPAEAVMQAVHVLNSVSCPGGVWFDHVDGSKTQWAVVWDHGGKTLYWRTHSNQNMQRLHLADAGITMGAAEKQLLVNSSELPWFSDAALAFLN